jgi:hypothetical protein
MTIAINAATSNRLFPLIQYLCENGWKPKTLPARGRLSANRQKVLLTVGNRTMPVRFSFYSVGGASRGRDHERRIQITTTYSTSFMPDLVFSDLVVGYDRDRSVYVGVDARRLHYGGDTSNASSFFSASGTDWAADTGVLTLPYPSQLFGTEYHSFFTASRFAEYIMNSASIHAGSYNGSGEFSRDRAVAAFPMQVADEDAGGDILELEFVGTPQANRVPPDSTISTFENREPNRNGKKISAAEYAVILKRREENGLLGEQFALDYEKRRLTRARRRDLAGRIE